MRSSIIEARDVASSTYRSIVPRVSTARKTQASLCDDAEMVKTLSITGPRTPCGMGRYCEDCDGALDRRCYRTAKPLLFQRAVGKIP
jgi:hypothetical protein